MCLCSAVCSKKIVTSNVRKTSLMLDLHNLGGSGETRCFRALGAALLDPETRDPADTKKSSRARKVARMTARRDLKCVRCEAFRPPYLPTSLGYEYSLSRATCALEAKILPTFTFTMACTVLRMNGMIYSVLCRRYRSHKRYNPSFFTPRWRWSTRGRKS